MGMKAAVTKKGEGAGFEIPPAGKYLGICNGVYVLGTQPGYQGGAAKQQVLFTFELHKRKGPAKDSAGRAFDASLTCTFTANTNSKMIELAGALEGRQYTDEDLAEVKEAGGFDPEALLDKVCWLDIQRGKKQNGDPKAVINTFSALDPTDDEGLAEQANENRETDSVYWDWTLGTEAPRRINYWWVQAAENPKNEGQYATVAGAANVRPTPEDDADLPF
jgi:hypothetical protein